MEILLHENIKRRRKERGLTQEQLSEALGVTVGAVYKWENGRSVPEIGMLLQLADLFEISLDALVGFEMQNSSVAATDERIFELQRQKKYAIVGQSGCGKSTLLNLLMASHSDYEGEINYGGTELRAMNSGDLYEMQSIVQQNVFVFNATIRDNITMFQHFPEEQINEAIRLSGLSALIEEKGEDYLCGENGSGLSGGEKQRISIARSLLKHSKVLLVDEATSALDAETAYQVSGAILGLEGITGIVVTHALDESLLRRYDSILTLKNGKIVEEGTFDSLIAEKGYFYSLFTISQ